MDRKTAHGRVLAACFLFFAIACSSTVNAQWKTGPTAPDVSARQILDLQKRPDIKQQYVIVDVRSDAESKVSIIPDAITVKEFEKNSGQYQGRAVIVYCTVGVRSAEYANKLKKQGWNAFNYKGSILDWCKNNLPLTTRDGKATKRVHGYSRWYSVPRNYVAVY